MENQTLQKWALIAEIVGGLAILVTLIILVFEINASTKAMRAQTAQEIWNQLSQAGFSSGDRRGETELFLKIMDTGFVGMDPVERRMALSQFESFMRVYDNAYYQYSQGTLDEDVFARFRAPIMARVQRPWFKEYWEERKGGYSLSFREYIDQLTLSIQ